MNTVDSTEAEAILMQAHDRSMSKDPKVAMDGRAMKAVSNFLIGWLTDELQRGSDPDDIIAISYTIGINIVASTAVTVIGGYGGNSADAAALLESDPNYLNRCWENAMSSLRNKAPEGPVLKHGDGQ